MRFILLLFVSVVLAGCVSQAVRSPLPPTIQHSATPTVGIVVEREVGETIIDESHLQIRPGLDFLEPLEFQINGFRFRVAAGAQFIQNVRLNGNAAYCGPGAMDTTMFQQGVFTATDLCFILQDGVLLTGGSVKPLELSGGTIPSFRQKEVIVPAPGFLRRNILYSGRTGDQLMVSYREFRDDFARSAFSQEVTFDLARSKEIGFRGARFEVLEATNTMIRYRLVQPFPDLKE